LLNSYRETDESLFGAAVGDSLWVSGGGIRLHLYLTFCLTLLLSSLTSLIQGASTIGVPILVYHRFGPAAVDTMTVTTPVFVSHLRYLKDNGYTVISLKQFVDFHHGHGSPLPPRAVVLTVDDAHRTVYTDMFPLIKQFNIPVTLFVYPSAIANAPYAMNWEQLREIQASGLFDIQSHSYWHPNFHREKKRLSPPAYEEFVDQQLTQAKDILEHRLGGHIDLLAWPFGLYDDDLIRKAVEIGYRAAFTIERRPARLTDHPMALPRYLMTDGDRGKRFAQIVSGRG
jgi:peptidoglycan/xylan/chitin deacetylase (PgdA/CDA1 family)